MKVLKDKVLVSVKEVAETTKTDFGFTLPTGALDNGGLSLVEVIEVGSNVENLKKGDQAFMYKGSGVEFTNPTDGLKYRVITTPEIVVVLD